MSVSPVSIVSTPVAVSASPAGSPDQPAPPVTVRWRGVETYETSFDAMRAFTDTRTADTGDEIWLVEHPPVYTLGQAGDPAHLLVADSGVPLVKVDRGGQITYHGPGQIVAYLLLDLRRRKLMVRTLVTKIEEAVIETLAAYNLASVRKAGAPGIYVASGAHEGAKIAALGLKIRNGCSYHGLSLNVKMDLRPFLAINPCGYAGLETVDMASLEVAADWNDVAHTLVRRLIANLDGASAAADKPQALEQHSND
ncbi:MULTISPECIES: lipoyl(octanoyl) transferase LipB [Burkholderia]|uniref:Octanoyltransferase n=1 Tax=Burkholderia cepacia TaxID=292 RepID=A0ABN5CW01_BURCE|nr:MULTISPECIES: lipoyl(octanoyl) transferase LipB [Burkholderia]AIO23135.1 lipoyl(octanoyl) transferase [Burkholderia cepacia ATCC 25416]ALK16737.1 lipoate--protein ligase [Burkholderia cepacia ATCC 25416]ASE94646.1 lipoyl(octanoyl) transferase LipB [Burkholderia cepacia]ATF77178.1 lipoate--protein ligase [Burkholderia cepacia]EMD9442363.1 lipoyl(octanoyl) transferase LipB [Burkholderia cepacia]